MSIEGNEPQFELVDESEPTTAELRADQEDDTDERPEPSEED